MSDETGVLFIVPTPVGNMADITLRAIEVLSSVDFIGAEDTRVTQKLLSKYDIKTTLFSYHKFNERNRVAFFLEKLKEKKNIAIVSDSGMPGISDPAKYIVNAAVEEGIRVCTLPGPSAFLPALISSGLNSDNFCFIGFLPSKEKDIKNKLSDLAETKSTIIFYEAPHRLFKTLAKIHEYFGDRHIVIAKEISKINEKYYRNKISYFLENPDTINLKGEFVICCDGFTPRQKTDNEIRDLIIEHIKNGLSRKSILNILTNKNNLSKNRVYKLYLECEKDLTKS